MQARDKEGERDDDEQAEAGGDDVSLMEVEQGELLAPDKDEAPEDADEVDVVAELERPAAAAAPQSRPDRATPTWRRCAAPSSASWPRPAATSG